MNKQLITELEEDIAALDARTPRLCQDFNAALMLRGAVNLLREADECREDSALRAPNSALET